MKTRRNMVKRWIAGVLAVTMMSSAVGTPAFAAPESSPAPETAAAQEVTAWSWTDAKSLTQQADTAAWVLALGEEQTISAQEDLTALLPDSVEATLSQPETTPAPEAAASSAAADTVAAADESAASEKTEEATPVPETATSDAVAASAASETSAADAEPTEEPAAGATTETLTLDWNTETLSYPLTAGDHTVTATLPEGCALAEDAPALTVIVQVPGTKEEDAESEAAEAPASNTLTGSAGASTPSMQADGGTVDTIDPVGTTINLFDYWIGDYAEDPQGDQTFQNPYRYWDPHWGGLYSESDGDLVNGINKDHILKFSRGGAYDGDTKYTQKGNLPTTGVEPYKNIVRNKLLNGYPQLDSSTVTQDWVANMYYEKDYDLNESLAYLFDSKSITTSCSVAHENVKGLLSLQNGYYTYDSSQNYAEYDSNSNSFRVYDQPNQGFFPFTSFNEISRKEHTDGSSEVIANHYFGLTMTTRFVQQNNGYTTDGTDKPVTYEFTGDDDVWVFIDGVLVGDLGGIHGAASLNINFSTGVITVNGVEDKTLYQRFEDAGSVGDTTWNSSNTTFANNTTHVLQLFYLERGNFDSNLKLSFNMESVFESSIKNVDQNGSAIPSTEFELYATGEDYNTNGATLVFQGTTESDGVLKLKDPNGQNITLEELKEKGYSNFVLKEQETPQGYRSAGEVHLYFLDGVDEPILLCANPWKSGAYANPAVTATLPVDVETQDGKTINTLTAPGTFFAVVMKRKPGGANDANGWQPVYGDPYEKGWSTLDSATKENILTAAQNSPYVFKPDNNGLRVTIDNLPGAIQEYHYILSQTSPATADNDAEYTVAYFYRENNDLYRLKTDNIDRTFSAQVCVSNIKNYLIVQQTNEDETKKLEGATYELYKDDGLATENGQLLLNDEGKPYHQNDTEKKSVGYYDSVTTEDLSQTNHDLVTAEGSAIFPSANKVLTKGTYYIVESKAPEGYNATQQIIKVVVNDTGVYANAGGEKDDVKVLRGAGKIMGSMLQFAVPDIVNTTLTDITATLETCTGDPTVDTTWDKVLNEDGKPKTLNLSYHTSEVPLEYGLSDASDGNTDPYFVVEEGWSHVSITQNYNGNKLANQPEGLENPGDKEELKNGNEILTNLFSRSTVVRVKNTVKLCDLTISNTIGGTSVGNDNNQTFEVAVKLTEGTTDNLADSYDYTVAGTADKKQLTLSKVESGEGGQPSDPVQKTGTVTMTPGQTITITGIPSGTGFAITAAENGNYTTEYSVTPSTVDGETPSDGAGTLTEAGTVVITNNRKTGSVSLTQNVSGPMGSYSDAFTYTLELYDLNGSQEVPISNTYHGTFTAKNGTPQSVTVTFTDGTADQIITDTGSKAISLQDSDTLVLTDLPAGAVCKATETTDNRGYTPTVNSQTVWEATATVPGSTTPQTITFINTRAAIAPTGLREENNPYIAMVSLAGLAALAGAAGWVEMRRRKRREEE